MYGVIFDVDGVIVDVRDSYHSAIVETFKYFSGEEISKDYIRKFKYEIYDFFDVIVDEDDVGDAFLRKPNPFPLHMAVEILGVDRFVYIGDTPADGEMVYFYRKIYGKPCKLIHYSQRFPRIWKQYRDAFLYFKVNVTFSAYKKVFIP